MSEPLGRTDVAKWIRNLRMPPLRKLVLLLLFEHSGPQASHDGAFGSFASWQTIADEAGIETAETVRRHVVALEDAGIVRREDRNTPSGRTTSRLVILLVPIPADERGASPPGSGEPPRPVEGGTTLKPQSKRDDAVASSGARARDDEVPDDFPAELRPHARAVMKVLLDVAQRHGAKAVRARAVGLVLMPRSRKPMVRAAHDFAAHFDGGTRQLRDVVAAYRNWLDREDDLAGPERLPGEGAPAAAANVTPLRRTARTERIERGLEAARAEGLI